MSLMELNERMIKLRKTFKKEIFKEIRKQLIELIYYYEDLYLVDKELCLNKLKKFGLMNNVSDESRSVEIIANNVMFNFWEKTNKAMSSVRRSPGFDYKAEVQIFPLKDKILMLFFGEGNLEQILELENDIKDYHFQNQCDKPNNITEEDWNQRYEDWKNAMPSMIPSKTGFTVSLFIENDLPFELSDILSKETLEQDKINMEKRLIKLAETFHSYPGFTGDNYLVFTSNEYKEFMKEKGELYRTLLEAKQDPLEIVVNNLL